MMDPLCKYSKLYLSMAVDDIKEKLQLMHNMQYQPLTSSLVSIDKTKLAFINYILNKANYLYEYSLLKNTFQHIVMNYNTFTMIRSNLLLLHQLKVQQKKFISWKLLIKKSKLLVRILKTKLRKLSLTYFRWWKYYMKYNKFKYENLKQAIQILKNNRIYEKKLVRKWNYLLIKFKWFDAVKKIQKKFRSYQSKLHFWAMKIIKLFIVHKYANTLLLKRNRLELVRIKYERSTINLLLLKLLKHLTYTLTTENGKKLKSDYITHIKNKIRPLDQNNSVAPIFPSRKIFPEMTKMWTISSKAMYIVELRCKYELTKLAIRQFRNESKPVYECPYCYEVSLLKNLFLYHKKSCYYNPDNEHDFITYGNSMSIKSRNGIDSQYSRSYDQLNADRLDETNTQMNEDIDQESESVSFHSQDYEVSLLKNHKRSKCHSNDNGNNGTNTVDEKDRNCSTNSLFESFPMQLSFRSKKSLPSISTNNNFSSKNNISSIEGSSFYRQLSFRSNRSNNFSGASSKLAKMRKKDMESMDPEEKELERVKILEVHYYHILMEKNLHDCVSWQLSKPIVDLAMDHVASYLNNY